MIATHSDVTARRFAEQDLAGFLLEALQREHTDWMQAGGDCPACRSYAAKLQVILNTHATRVSPLTLTA